MTVSKGEIWLANLNPQKRSNEVGKKRPVIVFQNNILNYSDYPTTIVMPMTTSLVNDAEPLRFHVTKRENLISDSDVLVAQIRSIDNDRFIEKIATLSEDELNRIKSFLDEIIE